MGLGWGGGGVQAPTVGQRCHSRLVICTRAPLARRLKLVGGGSDRAQPAATRWHPRATATDGGPLTLQTWRAHFLPSWSWEAGLGRVGAA